MNWRALAPCLLVIVVVQARAADSGSPSDPRAVAAFDRWVQKMGDHETLRATFDLTVFHTNGDAEASMVTKAQLEAIKPNTLRIDVLDAEGDPTFITFWRENAFNYYLFPTRTDMVFLSPSTASKADMRTAYRARWAELMTAVPERYSFLYFGMDAKAVDERFRLRFLEEEAGLTWIALDPRLPEDREMYRNLALVIDKKTGDLRRVAMIVSDNREYLLTMTSFEYDPEPPVTAESVQEGLPTNFAKTFFNPDEESE